MSPLSSPLSPTQTKEKRLYIQKTVGGLKEQKIDKEMIKHKQTTARVRKESLSVKKRTPGKYFLLVVRGLNFTERWAGVLDFELCVTRARENSLFNFCIVSAAHVMTRVGQ